MKKILIIICFTFLIFSAYSIEKNELSNKNKQIDYIVNKLKKTHPNPFFKVSKTKFYDDIQKLKNSMQDLTEDGVNLLLFQAIAQIQDAHTCLVFDNKKASFMPLEFYFFENEIIIISAIEKFAPLIGSKLIAINDVPIEKILKDMTTIIAHENKYFLWLLLPRCILEKEYLKLFNIVHEEDYVKITVEKDKKNYSEVIHFYKNDIFTNEKFFSIYDLLNVQTPLSFINLKINYWYKHFLDERILFIQYNKCDDMPDKNFKAFSKEISSILKSNNISSIILDVRFNLGGSGLLFYRKLLPVMKDFDKNGGKIFLLIGRRTFSSGVWVLCNLLRHTNVITIGEPVGNKPNHYGEVAIFHITDSNLIFRCSTKYFSKAIKSDDDTYVPKYYIPVTKNDWLSGNDATFDFAWKMALKNR